MNHTKQTANPPSPLSKGGTAFTLVELIVVVTILAILATIGFVSYSSYLTGVRDTNRLAQLVSIHDGLELYRTRKDLPLPDDNVEVQANGATVAYQGYVGSNTLETIDFTKGGRDPKDGQYFSYYLTKDRKQFQLMAFLEEESSITSQSNSSPFGKGVPEGGGITALGISSAFAVDYSDRLPVTYGRKLGILTNSSNTPIQEIVTGEIDLMTYTTASIAHFSDTDTFEGAGKLLYAMMGHKALKKISPTDCADGFIPVPGNPEMDQDGFCVAKYEMSYTDATTPDTVGGIDWNTKAYDASKAVVSESGKYPVAEITQGEAISSCQSIGNGYHLITNKEWMTIARNIELQKENWSNGTTGSGYIYNGNSNELTYGCNDNTGPRTWATATGGPDTKNLSSSRSSCDEKRQLVLSNGEIIWDLAGNVWEHVNKADTLDGSGFDTGINPNIGGSTGFNEWNTANSNGVSSYGPLLDSWDNSKGIGQYYQSTTGVIFIRGGVADHSYRGGLFALHLGWYTLFEIRNLGFRCAR